MKNDTGRNDTCPCGSGKKYKKCCLLKIVPGPTIFAKKRWGNVGQSLMGKILRHIDEVYGPEAVHIAWEEFHLFENKTNFDPNSQELPLFMPWFFYNWFPIDDELDDCPEISPGESLLISSKGLSADEKKYLKACLAGSFSFYEILEVDSGNSMLVTDILHGDEFLITEQSATQVAQPKDIFYGMVADFGEVCSLEASSSILIPPGMKSKILKIEDPDMEALDIYQQIFDHLLNPLKPVLTNTDGHLLIPHTLTFSVEDPMAAFEALSPLCLNETKEELLENAEFSDGGNLLRIDFPWLNKGNKKNKSWDNTILGHVEISEKQLIVEVNSKERARKFKVEIKKRLPTGQTLISEVVTSVESLQEASKKRAPTKDDLMNHPEAVKIMEEMMKTHWDGWVNEKLPALGGKTPRQASKTKAGRIELDILLNQLERNVSKNPLPGQTVETIRSIRTKLGINTEI